ncbi:hypothetical protein L1049_014667 [Liquidambar formosana]|uniref:Alpha/beta hydrolase fold-3 domain-containing protein n=1 Tax=Liquidambar formosana TaxID=63359 RepID=A0AAP0S2N0_LIQFO
MNPSRPPGPRPFSMNPTRPHGPRPPFPPEPTKPEDVAHQFFPFFRVYKDGRIERFMPSETVPPSDDPHTGVRSKDVQISSEIGVSVRIFMPKIHDPTRKIPLLFYIHGGGFSIGSAFAPGYHNYVSSLVAEANVIAVSVDYRLAPEHPIPACYEDSWEAFQWVASHANGDGPEPWLNNHADFGRVFVAGDSAGANISHTMAVRVGSIGLPGVKLVGVALVHPYFGGTDDDKMWLFMCPTHGGLEDPKLKPAAGDLARLGCERVLIFVAEEDHLRERGTCYYEELKKSGWQGTVEIEENKGENHVFHLLNPTCENAAALMKRLVSFFNQEQVIGGVAD